MFPARWRCNSAWWRPWRYRSQRCPMHNHSYQLLIAIVSRLHRTTDEYRFGISCVYRSTFSYIVLSTCSHLTYSLLWFLFTRSFLYSTGGSTGLWRYGWFCLLRLRRSSYNSCYMWRIRECARCLSKLPFNNPKWSMYCLWRMWHLYWWVYGNWRSHGYLILSFLLFLYFSIRLFRHWFDMSLRRPYCFLRISSYRCYKLPRRVRPWLFRL